MGDREGTFAEGRDWVQNNNPRRRYFALLDSMFNERHEENSDEGSLKSCHVEKSWKKWGCFAQRRGGNGES